jgi:ribonuclease Z
MKPDPQPEAAFEGTIHAERLFTLHGVLLDHGVPVLGAAMRETEHLSVNKDRLRRNGLDPGPWLRDLKHAVRRCMPADGEIEAATRGGGRRTFRIGELAAEILIRSPGQRIAYVTDISNTPANVEKVLDLARDADVLVCEAAFLHADRDLARERFHLTARDAGEIARAAGARRLAPFHLSPRYKGREEEILREAADAFGGPVLSLVNAGQGAAIMPGSR